MQAAEEAFGEKVVPDTPGTIGTVTVLEAVLDLVEQNLILPGMSARRTVEPGIEARTRDPQRLAEPCHRPDRTVLCN
ncbi:hypothetical protein GCM10010136_34620 [Limoniibacter endophyticus]|nr:hypothetical protein GCM10010136_34620 [Limoniibacter endophyticus]